MRIDIRDQVALVTGSAHRVGKAIALELARSGVHILVHYNSAADAVVAQTLAEIRAEGVNAHGVKADISRAEGVEQVFAALEAQFGRLNILVNSASNFQKRRLLDVTLQEWEDTLRINVTAPFLCTQAAVPLMRRNTPPGGSIVNLCDFGAVQPSLEYAHHGVSKAALHMLSQTSGLALGAENIRVNALVPGLVLRPPEMSEETWQQMAQHVPLRRPGSAEDVARAVVYLCSEDWLNGVTLRIDGGELLG
jgi:NAD(P)-dependent dehydrogenase (short-subunit alcohol dehydrogenase family)